MGVDLTNTKRLPQQQNHAVTNQAPTKTALSAFIKAKIASMMPGRKGDNFVTSIVSLANTNPALLECDQTSLVAACLQAQSLQLSLHQGMGQAWIIPFKDNKQKVTKATFQLGYKGYIQLAIRSG